MGILVVVVLVMVASEVKGGVEKEASQDKNDCRFRPSDLDDDAPRFCIRNVRQLEPFLPANDGYIEVDPSVPVELFCGPGEESGILTCANRELQRDGVKIVLKDLICEEPPTYSLAKEKDPKFPCEVNQLYRLSFVEQGFFHRQLRLCLNSELMNTFYSTGSISKFAKYKATPDNVAPTLNYDNGGYEEKLAVDASYEKPSSTLIAGELDSLPDKPQIVKGFLTPPDTFIYKYQNKAARHYLNTAPMFRSIKEGNWKKIEDACIRLAVLNGLDLTVHTGTHGILELDNLQKRREKVFLRTTKTELKMPVPKYIWKAVYDESIPKKTRGVVIVMSNNPLEPPTDSDYFCKNVCEQVNWIKATYLFTKNPKEGIFFCCAVDDFLRTVRGPGQGPYDLLTDSVNDANTLPPKEEYCKFQPTELDDKAPILVIDDTEKKALDKLLLPDVDGYVKVYPDVTILLECGPSKSKRVLKCDKDKMRLKIDDKDYVDAKDLTCETLPTSVTVSAREPSCTGNSYGIKFELAEFEYPLMSICWDDVKKTAVYTSSWINPLGKYKGTPAVKYNQLYPDMIDSTISKAYDDHPKPPFIAGESDPNPGFNKLQIVKGFLTPPDTFIYKYENLAARRYMNVAPFFSSIKEGNWKTIEDACIKLASHHCLTVHTGTYGVSDISDGNDQEGGGKKQGVFLEDDDKVPVPQYIWKAVYNETVPKDVRGVVIVVFNNPVRPPVGNEIFCADVCNEVHWLTEYSTNFKHAKKGYIFCCTVNDFLSTVTYAPRPVVEEESSQVKREVHLLGDSLSLERERVQEEDYCSLKPSDLLDNGPMFVAYDEKKFPADRHQLVLPGGGDGLVRIYPSMSISLYCTSQKEKDSMTCEPKKILLMKGNRALGVRDLRCTSPPKPKLHLIEPDSYHPCDTDLNVISFDLDGVYKKQMLICLSSTSTNTFYTTAWISDVVEYRATPSKEDIEPSRENMSDDVIKIVKEAYEYKDPKLSELKIVKGFLTPPESFIYKYQNIAARHYMNIVPYALSIKEGNWKMVEDACIKLVSSKTHSLTVHTGTYGVLNDQEGKGVFLGRDGKVPVPQYIWKAVYDESDPQNVRGVVVVVFNNPLRRPSDNEIFCADKCAEVKWIKETVMDLQDHNKGFIFCCEVNDFLRTVEKGPKPDDGKLRYIESKVNLLDDRLPYEDERCCKFPVSELGVGAPILTNDVASNTNYDPLLPDDDGNMVVCPLRPVQRYCSEKQRKLTLTCHNKRKVLQINDQDKQPKEITCDSPPKPAMRGTFLTSYCPKNIGQYFEIVFSVGFTPRLKIQICWDTDLLYPSMTSSRLLTSAKFGGTYDLGPINEESVAATTVRDVIEVYNTLASSVASGGRSKATSSKHQLMAGHLTPPESFAFAYEKKAANHYMNIVPFYRSVKEGNWKTVENACVQYGYQKKVNFTVHTGVYGILERPRNNKKTAENFYLLTKTIQKKIPVPKYIWKAVYDESNPKIVDEVVFVVLNNPERPPSKQEVFCADVCEKHAWIMKVANDFKKHEKGYVFCCEVEAFRNVVRHLPSPVNKGN